MPEASEPAPALPIEGPLPLSREHTLDAFDCGSPVLNEWLRKYARQSERKQSARTYVALRGMRVVGFYTLTMAEVAHGAAPPKIVKGLGKYPVPVVLLARLAVDRSEQGQGLGRALLKSAFHQAISAAKIVGCRAVLVHAKDERARAYYIQHGFEPSPTHRMHLMLSLPDIVNNAP